MQQKQQFAHWFENSLRLMVIVAFLWMLLPSGGSVSAQQGDDSTEPQATTKPGKKVFLPMLRNGPNFNSSLPLMTGIYPVGRKPPSYKIDPTAYTIDLELKPLDKWLTGANGGHATSIYGTFMNIQMTDAIVVGEIEKPLTVMWESGYVPFINIPALAGHSANYVATSSEYDGYITAWAKSFKAFANNGARFAYIAPLQEMNGYWVDYGGNPAGYIQAMKRFQTIFTRVGVPRQSVKWVFAPNGWTKPGMPMFEDYYPGDAYVDVVAISAYNFGYCNGGEWQSPKDVFNPDMNEGFYLDRLRAMAPSKPIFIAQTATSSYTGEGIQNQAEKDRWLREAYEYLAKQPNVKAVLYFNIPKECNWEIFKDGVGSSGYKTGVTSYGYRYITPTDLKNTSHATAN